MSLEGQSDEVNVEDVMQLIRQRIEARRHVACTDTEVARLADTRIEQALEGAHLDPQLLADLHPRSRRWNIAFDDDALYTSAHDNLSGRLLAALRRRLNPLLRLLMNPNPIVLALRRQTQLNTYYLHVLHEAMIELARLRLEVDALKTRDSDPAARQERQAREGDRSA
jgi:hypothetical protein